MVVHHYEVIFSIIAQSWKTLENDLLLKSPEKWPFFEPVKC